VKRERGTFVAPLAKMEVDEFDFVEPMRKTKDREATQVKHIKASSTSFPTLLPTEDIGQKELLPLFASMRKSAQRRQLVHVCADLKSDKEDFSRLEKVLEKYTWIPRPKESQFTEVEYVSKGESICTRSSLTEVLHFSVKVLEKAEFPVSGTEGLFVIRASATQKESVNINDLPASVNPTKVTIRHEKDYTKGPWTLRLSRIWSGVSIFEAEAEQMKGSDRAEFEVSIHLTDPWDLMEVRGSSDCAMSCAVMERAVFCVTPMLGV